MTNLTEKPHILHGIDRLGVRRQGNGFQGGGSLNPAEELHELPKVNTLFVFGGVWNDVYDIAVVARVAYLAGRITGLAVPSKNFGAASFLGLGRVIVDWSGSVSVEGCGISNRLRRASAEAGDARSPFSMVSTISLMQ